MWIEKPRFSEGYGWIQYRYTWRTTTAGAPARLKTAPDSVIDKWPELAAFRDSESRRFGIYCLWVRMEMPAKPTELAIDRDTGQPLEDQTPPLDY